MNSSIRLISNAIDEKFIKPLVLYHAVKLQFVNSCLFDVKLRMLEFSEKFNVSKQTLYTYFKILENKGLIYQHTNNLVLKSIHTIKKELKDHKQCKVTISDNDSLFDVQCRLYAKIIERHGKKIATMEAYRRFGIREWRNMGTVETDFQPSLSIRNIAKLLQINERTAKKVINNLERLTVLISKPQKPILKGDVINPALLEDYPGYHFIHENNLYVQFGNKIEFLEYPLKIPKISLKQYLNIYKSTQSKKYNNLNMGIS